jgi:S-adenosylmethionine/arginine decarboxylase-like enzyme
MLEGFADYILNEGHKLLEQSRPERVGIISDAPEKPSKDDHWGYHLILDMSGCNKKIDQPDVVRAFLKELVKKLDMVAVGEPIVKSFDDSHKGRGTSGIQLITTSTITFHSDDERWCVYLDVFSCKTYDPKVVFDAVNKHFEPKEIRHKWLYRDAGSWPHKKEKHGR